MVNTGVFYILTYVLRDQIRKNEIGGECGMCRRGERCIQGLGGGNPMEKGHLENLGMDRRILLKWVSEK
jgi:hypothetical protein